MRTKWFSFINSVVSQILILEVVRCGSMAWAVRDKEGDTNFWKELWEDLWSSCLVILLPIETWLIKIITGEELKGTLVLRWEGLIWPWEGSHKPIKVPWRDHQACGHEWTILGFLKQACIILPEQSSLWNIGPVMD